MSVVVPTVTATDAQQYREQMARVAPFAKRIHIDFCDGQFAPVRLVNPIQAYWPDGVTADLHLMLKRPLEHVETVISLRPDLVIIHAEAEGDTVGMLRELKSMGIKAGVALLQASEPAAYHELIAEADHVLIFSGDLGHFGGSADMSLLGKISQIRAINMAVELGWDGGINLQNAPQLAMSSIDVLNVGGYVHKAPDPKQAFDDMQKSLAVI